LTRARLTAGTSGRGVDPLPRYVETTCKGDSGERAGVVGRATPEIRFPVNGSVCRPDWLPWAGDVERRSRVLRHARTRTNRARS